jgi:hypothetical protein
VAVGGFSNTIVESRNGTVWSGTSSPNPGIGENSLASVSCSDFSICVTAGDYWMSGHESKTLVETGT